MLGKINYDLRNDTRFCICICIYINAYEIYIYVYIFHVNIFPERQISILPNTNDHNSEVMNLYGADLLTMSCKLNSRHSFTGFCCKHLDKFLGGGVRYKGRSLPDFAND